MLTVTLGELKQQARERADMVNSQFIADSELTSFINSSAAELYDMLIGVYEDYKLTSTNLSILPNVSDYTLPADFYKLRGVDLVLDSLGNAVTLKPFNFNERNAYLFTPTWNVVGLSYLRYHMQGNSIRFVPVPSTTSTVKLWYIPAITRLVNNSDVMDGVNGFEEYVIVDAAIKMRVKEESETSDLMAAKLALKARIEAMAANRDAGRVETVPDSTKNLPIEFWAWGNNS